jgi:16S rRNA (cytidine1402-2'-O)-methyltransferase
LVAAEDTRRTRALLSHLGLHRPLISVHGDIERPRSGHILSALAGGDVAFCTDAGMPALSDPGAATVTAARDAGHQVVVVPGPSAVTAALALSGFAADRFIFAGFLPRKTGELTRLFESLSGEHRTVVAFDSPQRLLKSLDIISAALPERRCAVARELTKVHEECRVAVAGELLRHYRANPAKGEITIVIEGAPKRKRTEP